ncbi:MAG: class II fructose-bisphosphatase, partial [Magnetospirillum sp.]|nr:class II fructose-bisphosphatase [Magnetospirillum sp.]
APVLDRNLALEVVRVTEASALAAAHQTGRGDEKAADQAACNAMQSALNGLTMEGVIVNGEGDDSTQPLHTGEKVGNGKAGPKVDIVLTALEGRSICARGAHNALSVVAMTEEGAFLKVPQHSYMEKIVVGAGLPAGLIDLDATPEENLARIAEAKGSAISDLTISILDRPRHADLIERLYAAGARVMLFDDGDVSGALAAGLPDSGVDAYMGSGGAAQGVLAAAGLKCLGAQMQCRLLIRSDSDQAAARRVGMDDPRRKWNIADMVRSEVMFAATGITDGHVLQGARLLPGNRAVSHSLVMRSISGTIRYLSVQHDLNRSLLPL